MTDKSRGKFPNYEPLVFAIRHMRKRLALRQSDLAGRIGCAQNTISQYESGKLHPSPEVLASLWSIADFEEKQLLRAYLAFMVSGSISSMEERKEFVRDILRRRSSTATRIPDRTIAEIFRLWAESDPAIADSVFREALGYIKVRLSEATAESAKLNASPRDVSDAEVKQVLEIPDLEAQYAAAIIEKLAADRDLDAPAAAREAAAKMRKHRRRGKSDVKAR
jgi:transcriptional regulator with XRE-family HTH domain